MSLVINILAMNDDDLNQTPIEELHLSMKTLGSLKRTQIHTIGDLMHYSQEDLTILDEAAGTEVIQALEDQFGLTLPVNDLQ